MWLFFIDDASMMLTDAWDKGEMWLTFLQIPKVIFYIVNDASSQIILKDRIKSLSKVWTLFIAETG